MRTFYSSEPPAMLDPCFSGRVSTQQMHVVRSQRLQPCRAQEIKSVDSLQNPAVKHAVKLRQSASYRRSTGTLLLTGDDLVLEAAESGSAHFHMLALVAGQSIPTGIRADQILELSEAAMRKLTGLETVPPGMLAAEADMPRLPLPQRPPPAGYRLLALDGVQDPGNLGTLLRTALAMGWDGAALLPGCADPFSDKCVRASRGAAFRLPIAQLGSLEEWKQVLQTHQLQPLAGMVRPEQHSAAWKHQRSLLQQEEQEQHRHEGSAAAMTLEDVQLAAERRRVCLVLGSEGRGVSAAVAEACLPISIPMPGQMESLNVSASGAVLMFALSSGVADLLVQLL